MALLTSFFPCVCHFQSSSSCVEDLRWEGVFRWRAALRHVFKSVSFLQFLPGRSPCRRMGSDLPLFLVPGPSPRRLHLHQSGAHVAARDGVLPPPASGRLRLRPLLHPVHNLHAIRAAGVHAMGSSAGRTPAVRVLLSGADHSHGGSQR